MFFDFKFSTLKIKVSDHLNLMEIQCFTSLPVSDFHSVKIDLTNYDLLVWMGQLIMNESQRNSFTAA